MTPTEFNEWLSARGADKPCPACDVNDWIGETEPEDIDKLEEVSAISLRPDTMPDGEEIQRVSYHVAYLLTCKNCGFMRLHNIKIVSGL